MVAEAEDGLSFPDDDDDRFVENPSLALDGDDTDMEVAAGVTRLTLVAGPMSQGFSAVLVDGKRISVGHRVRGAFRSVDASGNAVTHEVECVYQSRAVFLLKSPAMTLQFVNSDSFINVQRMELNRGALEELYNCDEAVTAHADFDLSSLSLPGVCPLTGLLGSSIHARFTADDTTVDDFKELHNDLFGQDFLFNRF
jgi:hypothetical protein